MILSWPCKGVYRDKDDMPRTAGNEGVYIQQIRNTMAHVQCHIFADRNKHMGFLRLFAGIFAAIIN